MISLDGCIICPFSGRYTNGILCTALPVPNVASEHSVKQNIYSTHREEQTTQEKIAKVGSDIAQCLMLIFVKSDLGITRSGFSDILLVVSFVKELRFLSKTQSGITVLYLNIAFTL